MGLYLLVFFILPAFGIITYKLLVFSHYKMYKKAHALVKKELNLMHGEEK